MADIYVNHTGSSTPPYDTEVKAATDIQVALDAASSGDTVWIKADEDYVMDGVDQQAAQFDVDVNDSVAIKGYYLNTGDQDYGGAYYKDDTNGWVVIDANSGAYHVFSAGNYNKLVWMNFKTINANTAYIPFDLTLTTYKTGYMVKNCWVTGGQRGISCSYIQNIIIQDCKFTGVYSSGLNPSAIYFTSTVSRGVLIESCEFTHGNAKYSICTLGYGSPTICNNTFNINGSVTSAIELGYSGWVSNNTIYENSGGAIDYGIRIEATALCSAVYNNIIVGCTISIKETAAATFGGWNCLYNNGSDWSPLREGDIQSDPQFMDAANGDFRLKPTSPCLNTGKPTPGSGYTSIGAWQRKSLLG